jgi:hypothetical protein
LKGEAHYAADDDGDESITFNALIYYKVKKELFNWILIS